jgi:hypothetical protein
MGFLRLYGSFPVKHLMVNELAPDIFFGPQPVREYLEREAECDGIIAANFRRSVRNF